MPWDSVGPGWVLAEYGTGTPSKPEPTILDLVSPTEARWALLPENPADRGGHSKCVWSGTALRPPDKVDYTCGTSPAAVLSLSSRLSPASITTCADRRIVGRRSAQHRQLLVVVPTAADGVADCTEKGQNEANNQHDDTDRPKDRDTCDKSDNEEGKTENDHRNLLFRG
jgi:hypothetical protein